MKKILKSVLVKKAISVASAALLVLSLSGASLMPVQAFGKVYKGVYKGKVLGETTIKPIVVAPAPKLPPPPPPPLPPAPAPAPTKDTKQPGPIINQNPVTTPTPVPVVPTPSSVVPIPGGILKNTSPNTILTLPTSGTTGIAVTASAGMNNSNNVPYSYLFLWGDGNYTITSAGVSTSTHSYNNPGSYTVIMMALLDSNVSGTANGVISIAQGAVAPTPQTTTATPPVTPPGAGLNVPAPVPAPAQAPAPLLPPDLQISVPASGTVGQPFMASAQVNNYSSPVAINFAWGNGNLQLSRAGNNIVTYSYTKPGSYLVLVSATINNTTISKSTWITIAPAPPVLK